MCVCAQEGTETRMVAFTDGVERFYDMIQVGGVYVISKVAMQVAKPVRVTRRSRASARAPSSAPPH